MLIYQPAFDAHHCAFRFLIITSEASEIETDRACIIDFYLAFPSALRFVRWPQSEKKARKLGEGLKNPYRDPINPVATFKSMRHLQAAAIRCLAASKVIESSGLERGVITRAGAEIAKPLRSAIDDFKYENHDFISEIVPTLLSMPLLGKDGLKDRTKLLEYRYDAS